MRARVVNGFSGGDVNVATAAIERDVAFGGDVGRGSIIGGAVSVEVVILEFDLNIAAQRVIVAGLFAFAGVDDDWMLFTDGQDRLARALRSGIIALLARCSAVLRRARRRRGDDGMASARLLRSNGRALLRQARDFLQASPDAPGLSLAAGRETDDKPMLL
jgi:hypothetical protein